MIGAQIELQSIGFLTRSRGGRNEDDLFGQGDAEADLSFGGQGCSLCILSMSVAGGTVMYLDSNSPCNSTSILMTRLPSLAGAHLELLPWRKRFLSKSE